MPRDHFLRNAAWTRQTPRSTQHAPDVYIPPRWRSLAEPAPELRAADAVLLVAFALAIAAGLALI